MIRKLAFTCLSAALMLTAPVYAQSVVGSAPQAERTHQRFVYDVYFRSSKIGKITRDQRKNDDKYYLSLSADLSFLFLKLGGYQNSTVRWQEDQQWYKPETFERRTSGLENISVSGSISDDSHHSQITKDGITKNIVNNEGKITELNSMFLQVRHGLLVGENSFDFYMQTSNKVEHYYFAVKGKEKVNTKYGQFDTIRIEQMDVKDRSLSVWFAPALDMQMVKFNYHRKVVDISGELNAYYEE